MRLPLAVISALAGLAAMLAGAILSLAPAAADGHLSSLNELPDDLELVLSLSSDPDNIVHPGREFTVEAALRYTKPHSQAIVSPWRRWVVPSGSDSELRIGGGLAWEGGSGNRARLNDFYAVGSTKLKNEPNSSYLKAFDQRTIVTRVHAASRATLYIFDAWSKELAGTVSQPAGTNDWFGQGGVRVQDPWFADAAAVWHETETTAWLFVVAPTDTVEGLTNTGRVHVFRLDWGVRTVEATLMATLAPPASEVSNRWNLADSAYYGNSITLSDDGSTLAVAAENINEMGAIYVYTRPDGPGENWGDISYADGVKVTPVAIPSLGSNAATAPFTPGATGRTGAATDCDAYCSRVHSYRTNAAEMGVRRVALSADGQVLTAGTGEKRFSMETPGGSFGGTYQKNSKGEAYVWVAPAGGWNAAPLANVDSDGDPKTLIAAKADATSFDPATHYSPGPLRRITEPDAVLVEKLWTDPSTDHRRWFSSGITISADGTTVASSGDNNSSAWYYIFQQSSVADWQALDGAYMTPTATVSGFSRLLDRGNAEFSRDGSTLLIATQADTGRLYVVDRPADGTWADINASTSPDVARLRVWTAEHVALDAHDESRIAFNRGATFTSDGGCTVELAEGTETFSCPIPFNGAVFVPKNTPEGTVAISARLTVQLEGVPDSVVRLEEELEVRISGGAPKLAEPQLELASDWQGTIDTADDRPSPSLIERGGKTQLRLQILDETGQPASTGSVSSLVVSTTLGGLTSQVPNGACEGLSGLKNCTVPTSALTVRNSDELLFELAHQGTAGTATVWATLVSEEGETLTSNRLMIDVAGPPTALAIAAPTATLLGYAPAEDTDPRNKTTLTVSASDKGGNRASVPDTLYSAKLTDPDGKAIAITGTNRKAAVVWPLRENDADTGELALRDGNPQARVTILAAKTAPLAIGEYTLELTAGPGANKLTATQKFNVAGGAAAVELSSDPAGEISEGATVTFTAAVTDAAGNPVPDGTPVTFSEQSAGSNVALVLLSGARQLTSGGEASVQLRAVGRGRAYVTASSDDERDIELVTVVEPPPPPLEQSITDLTIGGFTIWAGAQSTTAAALFAALEGVTRVSMWDGIEWISYGVQNNMLTPGSVDYIIPRGAALWLTGE